MSEREITITLKGKNLLASDFQKAREQILGLGTAADDAGSRSSGMAGAFKTAAASMAGFLGGAAILGGLRSAFDFAVGGAIDMNATLEKSTLQFATLMGDSQKAESHVRDLFEFAKKTPFETGPIIEASKMMRTFGGDTLDTMANLTLIGDASAATGAPINELGFWVGRLYSNLKAGQPFGEAAARLQELAVMSPEARQQMEAMQKAGKSTEEVFAVFQGRLGDFSGAMVAQANTWGGLTSSISDAVNIMMADALKPLFDLVKTGAQVVLAALGSEGLEAAFNSVRDTMKSTLGTDANGGAGLVKGMISGLLTGVDLGIAAIGLFGQGWNALKGVVYGAASVIVGVVENIIGGFKVLVDVSEKVPGIGSKFKGLGDSLRFATDFVGSLKTGMADLAKEALEGAQGQDTFGKTVSGARTMVQALRSEVEKATVATNSETTATRTAGSAKNEYVAKTKEQIAAEKEAQKSAEKLNEEIRKFGGEYAGINEQLAKGYFGKLDTELRDTVSLTSQSLDVTGRLHQKLIEWATTNGAVLAPSIKSSTDRLKEMKDVADGDTWATFNSRLDDLGNAFRDLAQTADGAFGDIAESVGTMINAMRLGRESGMRLREGFDDIKAGGAGAAAGVATFAAGLVSAVASMDAATRSSNRLQATMGGVSQGAAIGTAIWPGYGTAIGAVVGGVIGFVRSMNSVAPAAEQARRAMADFQAGLAANMTAMQRIEAGGDAHRATLISIRDAYIAQGFSAEGALAKAESLWAAMQRGPQQAADAMAEVARVMGQNQDNMTLARQAMEEWGISSEEAGHKFAQADMDGKSQTMLSKLKAAQMAGVDLNAIIAKGGDDFGKLAAEARRTGTTIPIEFKPVMAAMIEAGTLVDENGEKLTDLSEIPFATDIGEGLKGIGDSLKELADFFMGRTQNAMETAAEKGVSFGDRVRTAIQGIPRNIEINVNGKYNAPDIDGASPGYATGTKGAHGSYFVNFGGETSARLHGVEAVLRPDDAPGFVAEYLQRNPQASGPAVVNVYTVAEVNTTTGAVKQRVISELEYLKRSMRRVIRANGIPELAGATA